MLGSLSGAGLGLRRELLPALKSANLEAVDFFEIAPENWMAAGGRFDHDLRWFTERYPFACHGLSLSIGSADPLDVAFIRDIKHFLDRHNIDLYTEHLSWCSYNGHLYDLLPIPFTDEAVKWVAQRVKTVQDILERPIALENASYYFTPPSAEMTELQFIRHVLEEANCGLHLDVNNIYVNSQNLGFNAKEHLEALPLERTRYLHVAGHYQQPDGIIIDTHGATVLPSVWDLLSRAYELLSDSSKPLPTCLERDFNFPTVDELLQEVQIIGEVQSQLFCGGNKRISS